MATLTINDGVFVFGDSPFTASVTGFTAPISWTVDNATLVKDSGDAQITITPLNRTSDSQVRAFNSVYFKDNNPTPGGDLGWSGNHLIKSAGSGNDHINSKNSATEVEFYGGEHVVTTNLVEGTVTPSITANAVIGFSDLDGTTSLKACWHVEGGSANASIYVDGAVLKTVSVSADAVLSVVIVDGKQVQFFNNGLLVKEVHMFPIFRRGFAVVALNGTGHASNIIKNPQFYHAQDGTNWRLVTSVDTVNDEVSSASHGILTDAEVRIAGDDIATGLSMDTRYFAEAVTGSTLSFHTAPGIVDDTYLVNLTADNGDFYVVESGISDDNVVSGTFSSYGVLPVQPNYPYTGTPEDNTQISVGEDSKRVTLIKESVLVMSYSYNNLIRAEFDQVNDFRDYHKGAYPFYVDDIVLGKRRMMRFSAYTFEVVRSFYFRITGTLTGTGAEDQDIPITA